MITEKPLKKDEAPTSPKTSRGHTTEIELPYLKVILIIHYPAS